MKFQRSRFTQSCLAFFVLCSMVFPVFPRVGRFQMTGTDNAADAPRTALVAFEENRGQFDPKVRYVARTGGAQIFLTADEAVYVLGLDDCPKTSDCRNGADDIQTDPISEIPDPESERAFALRMKFVGADPGSAFAGEDRREQTTNYFKEKKQFTDIPNYGTVRFENIYDGIGLVWRGLERGATRYDFIVEPQADAGQIALRFDGADEVETDANGDLLIRTVAGTIRQAKPFTYQEADGSRQEVESRFVVDGAEVRFDVGEYDRTKPLIIDPTVTISNLAFSTMLGSFSDDFSNDITVDANGNSYITGRTDSVAFPTTAGTFDTTANGSFDVFVAKFNGSGTGLVFATYLGGPTFDEGGGIAVDSSGNIYVTGSAGPGFPTTGGAYDTVFNGGADVFVTKLNAGGSMLLYSTYIGASQIDQANDLAIDGGGNAYVVVRTSDAVVDYPTTGGAFDTTHNGGDDVAVTKLSANGATLVYSTFLGGSSIDVGRSICVNAAGEVHVAGSTTDDVTDFPTTAGAYDMTHNGLTDFFVTHIDASGSTLLYSTLIGGAGIDNANGLAVDAAGNAYVAGAIGSGFPTTGGVVDTTAAGSNETGVSKLSANGSTLVYSTYLGGTQSEVPTGVAVDQFGNAYVTGNNFGGDYPTTGGAFDTTFNGSNDAFLTVLNQNASALIYSTYLGGGGSDFAEDVTLDTAGNIYLTGRTSLSGAAFPTSPEAFQVFNAGGSDAFVTKFGDYAISGKVIDSTSGAPIQNVMVALSGQVSGNVLTGPDGRFGFLDTVPGEPHTVSATRSGYAINPALFNIASLNNNRELIFVGTIGSPTGGSGGTLQFADLSYTRSENGSTVSITVNRTGKILTTEPVTVDFTTIGDTAVAGQDFQPVTGVLVFNALETVKTIEVPLIDDGVLEPRESFRIQLSNPTNNSDIEPNRDTATVQILDEDLAGGDLLISEFRQRGRLGANDEYVKLFNPNGFDVTVQTADGSDGLTLARSAGADLISVAAIPNLVTIPARGHYLLTNNSPNGGFSVIDYPTGSGTVTAVGDRTFSSDIPDNSNLVLLNTAEPENFTPAAALDAVGFGDSPWTEGKGLTQIIPENSEMSYVRRLRVDGLQDTGSNAADFLLVENHARVFTGSGQKTILAALGAPAPETSESLRLAGAGEIPIVETMAEVYDPTPVPNGAQGTLTVYRRITNNTERPVLALRLRAVDFPTAGSMTQWRYSSRPDFRLFSSADEGATVKGLTLAAERLQPNGGGINSTLTVDAVTSDDPLMPGESITVAVRFGVMRYGRHPITLAAETLD